MTREQKLKLVWKHTHRDYKGVPDERRADYIMVSSAYGARLASTEAAEWI